MLRRARSAEEMAIDFLCFRKKKKHLLTNKPLKIYDIISKILKIKKNNHIKVVIKLIIISNQLMEATTGFEPVYKVLQTSA